MIYSTYYLQREELDNTNYQWSTLAIDCNCDLEVGNGEREAITVISINKLNCHLNDGAYGRLERFGWIILKLYTPILYGKPIDR